MPEATGDATPRTIDGTPPAATGSGPSHDSWTNDVVLGDGSTVRVRPISPDDGPAILAFHERQSRESIYFRFFSPRPRLSDADVAHMTTVDGTDRMAFVAMRDDQLLGVARWDRLGNRPVAEVAFFTDDAHGGRGIATLLLEYLAARARTVGIERFEAHVLPANRRMVGVFRQAGFEATSTFADGVIEVTLDIEPTGEALDAMRRRAASAERQAVVRLLEPETVAVVGAGGDASGVGRRVIRNLLREPFAGTIHPVHPSRASVAGVRAYARVTDIPGGVDLAVICVPATEVVAVLEDCGRARVGAAIVISAGFAEAGADGRVRQDQVVATARRFGLRVLGPNCLGVVNTDPAVRLHATFAELDVRPGSVGLLSQSGTLGAVILDRARRVGLGVSSFVAVGNKADLSGNDLLRYWLDDGRTDVVLLYLESFGNPRRFGRNVRAVAADKPVFAVRAGGRASPVPSGSGPGSADGADWLDDDTVDALLRQAGVVRVPTVSALLDAGLVADRQPAPAGTGVAIVGNSGGAATMAADACVTAGLHLADLPGYQPGIAAFRLQGRQSTNPLDLPFDVSVDGYVEALSAVAVAPGVDSVLVVHSPTDVGDADRIVGALDRVVASHPDITFVASIFGPHPAVTPGGVPVFDFPDDAAHALGRVVRHAVWRAAEGSGTIATMADVDAFRREVDRALRGEGGSAVRLGPTEARTMLAAGGVATVPVRVVTGPEVPTEATLQPILTGDPDRSGRGADDGVAVKADGHDVGARTTRGGVALDLRSTAAVRAAIAEIADHLGSDAWPMVVQPMVAPGVDVRVAIEVHPIVGAVVHVGPGGGAGRYVSAGAQVLPVTDRTLATLVDESAFAEDLREPARRRLVELVGRLAACVDAAPEIVELVCDPVIVRDDGADIVDVTVQLAPVDATAPPVRRLDAPD